jgi:hypothetical protein
MLIELGQHLAVAANIPIRCQADRGMGPTEILFFALTIRATKSRKVPSRNPGFVGFARSHCVRLSVVHARIDVKSAVSGVFRSSIQF